MKKYVMRYRAAAEDSLDGWENQSLPIGNGYFGASVFGGEKSERVQFTTNEFANVYSLGGVTSFADLYIESDFAAVTDYERGLDLSAGAAYSRFRCGDEKIERTAFCSYPDNVFVYGIATSGKRDFTARLVIPYLGAREEKDGGKRCMQQTWQHILAGLCSVLKQDAKIRPDAFNEQFTVEKFADVLFFQMLSALLRQDYDPAAVLGVVSRTLY